MAETEAVEEPENLLCPITQVMFRDPVVNNYGHTYEREALRQALCVQLRDPLTNLPLPPPAGGPVFSNRAIRCQVDEFLETHPSYVPQGWPDRTRVPTVNASLEEEVCQFRRMQAWAIRWNSPLQDLIVQMKRFMSNFMLRPSSLLPQAENHSRVARLLGIVMGLWLGDELALLGGHAGWKAVILVLRLVIGVDCTIADMRLKLVAQLRALLSHPMSFIDYMNLAKLSRSLRRKAQLRALLFENKTSFLKGCWQDIQDLQDHIILFDIVRSPGQSSGRRGPGSGRHTTVQLRGRPVAKLELGQATWWQLRVQRAVLQTLVQIAALRIDLGGYEVGYKTTCAAYDGSGSALQAIGEGGAACARIGFIAGSSYAVLALGANAAIKVITALLMEA